MGQLFLLTYYDKENPMIGENYIRKAEINGKGIGLCSVRSRFPLETNVLHIQSATLYGCHPSIKLKRDPYSLKNIMLSGHMVFLEVKEKCLHCIFLTVDVFLCKQSTEEYF